MLGPTWTDGVAEYMNGVAQKRVRATHATLFRADVNRRAYLSIKRSRSISRVRVRVVGEGRRDMTEVIEGRLPEGCSP